MIQHSRLDKIYRSMLITKFFEKGWGKPENLQRLFEFRKFVSNRDTCYNLVPKDYPVQITKHEKTSDCQIIEGRFVSPMELYLPGLVPKESIEAHFQVVLPLKWRNEKYKPICVHLAGTGDHFYWKRRNFLAKPLLREGNIGAILLENPYYGVRKPKEQVRSNLNNVSDIFVMGGCLILENLVLFHWCERNGFGPLGISGLSMGGHMASLAATNWPRPLVLVPCLSWSTAAAVFTQGVMSHSINWDMLETQYLANGDFRERLAKMVTVVDDSFRAGQQFIKHFKESMTELKHDMKDVANDSKATNQSCKMIVQDNGVSKLGKCDNNTLTTPTSQCESPLSSITKPEIVSAPSMYDSVKDAGNVITSVLNGTTKLMDFILPIESEQPEKETKSNGHFGPIDTTKVKWWEREALQFMRGMMDECTHLKNFSVPYDTSLITAICAKDDAYVPRDGCSSLEEVWPGAEIKYLDAGHVSAYMLHQKIFRSAIIDAFQKSKEKYDPDEPRLEPTITADNLKSIYQSRIQSQLPTTITNNN